MSGAGRPGAVLFDLDGTLLDLPVDIEPVRREVERLLVTAGQGGPARPLLDAIDRAAAAVAMDRGAAAGRELRAQARCLVDIAELAAARSARPRPGAVDAVSMLAAKGFRLGIVTDNGRACLGPALVAAGLDGAALYAVTRDDVERPKPAADGVVLAARTLCPSGGTIWYAGDSPRDVSAARAAADELGPDFRLRVVGVLGGRGDDDLRRAVPDDLVSDLTAFASLVDASHDF